MSTQGDPRTKLSKSDAAAIRHYASGLLTHSEIALRFHITPGHVSRIVNGRSWALRGTRRVRGKQS
jgi:hypothetical protein